MQVKSGYKTSEFWVTLLTMVGVGFGLPIPPEVAVWVIGGMASVYTASRALVKGMVR